MQTKSFTSSFQVRALEQRLKQFADILIALHAFKLYIITSIWLNPVVMSREFNYILAQSINRCNVIGIV